MEPSTQQFHPGDRCLASLNESGTWETATVHRRNEDGTYTIEFFTASLLLPYLYGVTGLEMIEADGDAKLWSTTVFDQWATGNGTSARDKVEAAERRMTKLDFRTLMIYLDFVVGPIGEDEKFEDFWQEACRGALSAKDDEGGGVVRSEDDTTLSREESYHLLRQLKRTAHQALRSGESDGNSAPTTTTSFYKMYWNEIRMGGR